MSAAKRGLVAALDCGTSLIKAGVFDLEGQMLGHGRCDAPCRFQPDGRVEQDPSVLEAGALEALREAVDRSGRDAAGVEAICVANQRATFLCIGRDETPICHAVSWLDGRGADEVAELRTRISDHEYYGITGIPNNPVFTLARLLWIRKNEPELWSSTRRFVLVHDYIMRRLGCEGFVTDWSNASLTGMLDLASLSWSARILELAGLDEGRLSRLGAPGTRIGSLSKDAARRCGLLEGTALVAGGGDQQCAGLGAGAVEPGVFEVTLGTAGVALGSVAMPVYDDKMRVMCCAHADPGRYEIEGFQNSAGSCLQWIGRLMSTEDMEASAVSGLVDSVEPGSRGVIFYPYLGGASAPRWDPRATGILLGLKHSHGKAELARAVIEGVCLEMREILDVFESLGHPVKEIRVTGGGTRIVTWIRILADVTGRVVVTLRNLEATLLGAAMLAAVGAGAFDSVSSACKAMVRPAERFEPEGGRSGFYEGLFGRYRSVADTLYGSGVFSKLGG